MRGEPYIVLFDGRCRICQRGRQMIRRLGPTAPVKFVDVHDHEALSHYPQVEKADTRGEMHVIDPAGRLSSGYDAMVALAPILPPVAWLGGVLKIPRIRALGHWAYKWLAANRYRLGGQVSCHDGACQLRV